jgi:hypothetical protein
MSFLGVLEAVGKDFAKGLKFALTYAVPVESLVALIFPATAPVMSAAEDATTLIQNSVIAVEQKFSAAGLQSGTGAQKLAEVLTLSQQAVTTLLAQAGITASPEYISSLVNAVVAILNAQPAPSAAPQTVVSH